MIDVCAVEFVVLAWCKHDFISFLLLWPPKMEMVNLNQAARSSNDFQRCWKNTSKFI